MRSFYRVTKQIASMGVVNLSVDDIEAIFIEEGVSEADLLAPLHNYIDSKVAKAQEIATAYDNLSSQVTGAVDEMLSKDAQLAKDFKSWKQM